MNPHVYTDPKDGRATVEVAVSEEEAVLVVQHRRGMAAFWAGMLSALAERGHDVSRLNVCGNVCGHVESAVRRILAARGAIEPCGCHAVEVAVYDRAGIPLPDVLGNSDPVWPWFDGPGEPADAAAILDHARSCTWRSDAAVPRVVVASSLRPAVGEG